MEGRIPLEELSWKRVTRPSEIVRRNQVVEAKIVKIDAESRQIILSIRQLRPNPWEDIAGKWGIGDIVEAKVQRLMSFGAFVELAPEIEGASASFRNRLGSGQTSQSVSEERASFTPQNYRA